MRVPLPPEKSHRLINHGPCPLMTTGDGARRNVAPINWTVPIQDDPPLILCAVESGNFTDELLKASGQFALSLVSEEHAAALLACGRRSGRDGDKFAATGLTPLPCVRIGPPRLAQSFGHLELQVQATHPYDGVTLYVGRVLHAEAEEGFLEDGHLNPAMARTLHHLGSGRFAVADRLLLPPKL